MLSSQATCFFLASSPSGHVQERTTILSRPYYYFISNLGKMTYFSLGFNPLNQKNEHSRCLKSWILRQIKIYLISQTAKKNINIKCRGYEVKLNAIIFILFLLS